MASKQKWKKVRVVVEVTTCDPRLTERGLCKQVTAHLGVLKDRWNYLLFTHVSRPKVKQFSRVFAREVREAQDD